jgi:hypothetical protein
MTSTPLDFGLQAFLTADHAAVVEGKLYVNGGCWNGLNFPTFPHPLPPGTIVVVIEVPFAKYNADHDFGLTLEDPDGQVLDTKVEGNFRVGMAAAMNFGDPTLLPMAIPLPNIVLPRPGDYSFVFSVDREELGRFRVRAAQGAVGPAA